MPEGTIIKALSGFYYVKSGEGVMQCRARGVFRKKKITPLVGDHAIYEVEPGSDGYIVTIGKRRNVLSRPPIANVDQAVLIFSVAEPDFDGVLLDRFLVHMEASHVPPLICLTKDDLNAGDKRRMLVKRMIYYETIGYPVYWTSSQRHEGIHALSDHLKGRISVFAGQSGVGKSSLLNVLNDQLHIDTQTISQALGRGKHTTRHVELLQAGGGWVADTPGFSSLDFSGIDQTVLEQCFPDFSNLRNACRFRGCLHMAEPGCAVKAAVEHGDVDHERYMHYCAFHEEIGRQKKVY
ncbi:MAG: ribosome small subunit-dependent GTPase A [Sporolactobacillus sp.]